MDKSVFELDPVHSSENSTANDPSPTADVRPPLEYAISLDTICARLPEDANVYVATESPTLLQAVINRHDYIISHEAAIRHTHTPDDHAIQSVTGPADVDSTIVDHVLLLEPDATDRVHQIIDATETEIPHDCLVGNPYSFNRIENRAVDSWLSPHRARTTYESSGFETKIVGYHGPRSILQSLIGRFWQTLGRPDKRDVYTHCMRAVYREEQLPLAMLSCVTHVKATPIQTER
ncbi:hypothetical protein Halar_0628 (plasmid) [halophilic archaeon DL31]|jgi:hypothetical protein|nr:hypothetical protein Halar_0628 [halophilic archaeon DL31]